MGAAMDGGCPSSYEHKARQTIWREGETRGFCQRALTTIHPQSQHIFLLSCPLSPRHLVASPPLREATLETTPLRTRKKATAQAARLLAQMSPLEVHPAKNMQEKKIVPERGHAWRVVVGWGRPGGLVFYTLLLLMIAQLGGGREGRQDGDRSREGVIDGGEALGRRAVLVNHEIRRVLCSLRYATWKPKPSGINMPSPPSFQAHLQALCTRLPDPNSLPTAMLV